MERLAKILLTAVGLFIIWWVWAPQSHAKAKISRLSGKVRLKAVITTLLCCVVIYYVWTRQIDPKATILRFFEHEAEEKLSLIAVRDENTIYQGSHAVGTISGEVKDLGDTIIFTEICNTSNLNLELTIEYRRERLRIIKPGSFILHHRKMVGSKAETRDYVRNNVVCKRIE